MAENLTASSDSASIFQLLHRAEQRAKLLFSKEADNVDLTLRQTAILQAVQDGGTVIQSDIVQRTGIDRSTVTELMGRLDARGLVTRVRSRRDARAYMVTLTANGSELLAQAGAASDRAEALFINALPDGLREQFVNGLRAVAGMPAEHTDQNDATTRTFTN